MNENNKRRPIKTSALPIITSCNLLSLKLGRWTPLTVVVAVFFEVDFFCAMWLTELAKIRILYGIESSSDLLILNNALCFNQSLFKKISQAYKVHK